MGSTTDRPDDSGTDSGRASGGAAAGAPTLLDTVGMQLVAIRASLDALTLQVDAMAGSYAAALALVRSAGGDTETMAAADRARESVDALRATLNLDRTKPRRFFGDPPAAADPPGASASGIT